MDREPWDNEDSSGMDPPIHMLAHKLGKFWKFKIANVNEWIRRGTAAQGEDE